MIDIIMPTYNSLTGKGLLLQAVNALYAHTFTPFRLIILDASNDELTSQWIDTFARNQTKNKIEHHRLDGRVITKGNQNVMWGLEHCHDELAVFMADSTIVEPCWFESTLPIFTHFPDCGIVGSKLLYPNGLIEHCGIMVNKKGWQNIAESSKGHLMVAPPIRECPVVGFALVTFRTDVIRKALDLQTYDTFNSIEDLDACFSIRKMGYKVMCNWLSVAYHHAGATRWKDDSAMDILMENWERFKTKWGDGVPDA